jgi:hypothetical protein
MCGEDWSRSESLGFTTGRNVARRLDAHGVFQPGIPRLSNNRNRLTPHRLIARRELEQAPKEQWTLS